MESEITTRPIYVRHTGTDGKSHVQQHVVWDAAKFVESQRQAAMKLNDDQKPGAPAKADAQQITHEQYLKERTK